MEINSIKRDSAVIKAGTWVGDIPEMGDLRLRVRGLTSPQVVTLRSSLERKAPKSDRNRDGSLKNDASIRIFSEVLYSAVLLEWEGITEDGKPVPYNADVAKEWLTNPDYRAFADAVTWAANAVDNGNAENVEELAKNSPALSDGKSKTAK